MPAPQIAKLVLGLQRSPTSPLTYAFDCNGGTLLVVGVAVTSVGAGASVTNVTYAGTGLTKGPTVSWDTNFSVTEIWYLLNPASSSNNVIVTATTNTDIFSQAISYTSNDPKTPIRQQATATSNSTTASVTLSSVLTGSHVVSMCGTGSGVTGWDATLIGLLNQSAASGGDNAAMQYTTLPGNQSAVMNHSVTSDNWGIVAVEIQGASDLEAVSLASADVLLDAYGPFHAAGTAFQGDAFQENAFQVLGGTSGGPATYNESVSASALALDALATIQIHNTSTDAVSALAQDALATAQAMNASLSASALAQDVLATIQIMTASEAPSALAQDQLATQQVMLASESESATAAEAFATAQIMLASLSETALAQDVAIGVLQIPIGFSETSLADVLFDADLAHAGGGNTYSEAVSEGALAEDSVDAGLRIGTGIEAKIGGAGAGTSIFVFDD